MLQSGQALFHRRSWSSPDLQSTLSTGILAYRNLAMDFRWPFRIATSITNILTEYLCGFPQLQAYVRLEPWCGTWPLFLISFPSHNSFVTFNCRKVRVTDGAMKYINLSFYLWHMWRTWRHTLRGSVEQLMLNLGSDGAKRSKSRPCRFTLGNSPLYEWSVKLVRPRSAFNVVVKRKVSCFCRDLKRGPNSPWSRSYTDYTTPVCHHK